MKKSILYLVAALCFLVAGLMFLFFAEEHSVTLGGAFVALGCAFVAIYMTAGKKSADKKGAGKKAG